MKIPVLMVEDDQATGEVLSEVLEDAGYEVVLAGGGAEALKLLEQAAFTVVVSDIRMPSVDGIDVLHAARESDAQPEVILLTGYGALDTSLVALREGAFDYLLKPCNPETLLQRVAEAVEAYRTRTRQHEAVQRVVEAFGDSPPTNGPLTEEAAAPEPEYGPQDQPIQLGDLLIGKAHHTALFQDEPLHLTPTEHALLRRLAEKPGRVFPYRELVYAMHGYDVTNVEAKVLLKTHVRNIRRKIGSDYLVNVRSTGYKLVLPEELSNTNGESF